MLMDTGTREIAEISIVESSTVQLQVGLGTKDHEGISIDALIKILPLADTIGPLLSVIDTSGPIERAKMKSCTEADAKRKEFAMTNVINDEYSDNSIVLSSDVALPANIGSAILGSITTHGPSSLVPILVELQVHMKVRADDRGVG